MRKLVSKKGSRGQEVENVWKARRSNAVKGKKKKCRPAESIAEGGAKKALIGGRLSTSKRRRLFGKKTRREGKGETPLAVVYLGDVLAKRGAYAFEEKDPKPVKKKPK